MNNIKQTIASLISELPKAFLLYWIGLGSYALLSSKAMIVLGDNNEPYNAFFIFAAFYFGIPIFVIIILCIFFYKNKISKINNGNDSIRWVIKRNLYIFICGFAFIAIIFFVLSLCFSGSQQYFLNKESINNYKKGTMDYFKKIDDKKIEIRKLDKHIIKKTYSLDTSKYHTLKRDSLITEKAFDSLCVKKTLSIENALRKLECDSLTKEKKLYTLKNELDGLKHNKKQFEYALKECEYELEIIKYGFLSDVDNNREDIIKLLKSVQLIGFIIFLILLLFLSHLIYFSHQERKDLYKKVNYLSKEIKRIDTFNVYNSLLFVIILLLIYPLIQPIKREDISIDYPYISIALPNWNLLADNIKKEETIEVKKQEIQHHLDSLQFGHIKVDSLRGRLGLDSLAGSLSLNMSNDFIRCCKGCSCDTVLIKITSDSTSTYLQKLGEIKNEFNNIGNNLKDFKDTIKKINDDNNKTNSVKPK